MEKEKRMRDRERERASLPIDSGQKQVVWMLLANRSSPYQRQVGCWSTPTDVVIRFSRQEGSVERWYSTRTRLTRTNLKRAKIELHRRGSSMGSSCKLFTSSTTLFFFRFERESFWLTSSSTTMSCCSSSESDVLSSSSKWKRWHWKSSSFVRG